MVAGGIVLRSSFWIRMTAAGYCNIDSSKGAKGGRTQHSHSRYFLWVGYFLMGCTGGSA
jgi:hypothetical protein